jgi:phospholipase/carboxylesterase
MKETESATRGSAESPSRQLPEMIETSTGPEPRNSVIWLHGLGADGHDFEPVVPMLGMEQVAATRFIFPHAPMRPVTLNGGMVMRAWYDIRGMNVDRDQDEEGIEHSAGLVRSVIDREIERGIHPSHIVLAGFSQGGAIAAYVGMRYPKTLAGLMVLSAYLLFPGRLADEISPANMATSVFAGHGSMDPMVPVAMGRDLATHLEALRVPVSWHEYMMPHSVIPEELADIGAWLRSRLKAR